MSPRFSFVLPGRRSGLIASSSNLVIYLSISLPIGLPASQSRRFCSNPFQIAVGDKRDYLINLLVPFDALEAQEGSLMPPGNIESTSDSFGAWEPEMRAALPEVSVEVRGELCQLKRNVTDSSADAGWDHDSHK